MSALFVAALALAQPTPSAELHLKFQASRVQRPFDLAPEITLKNTGKTVLRLVMPGDGSDYGWRSPHIGWGAAKAGAREPMPSKPNLKLHPRCGVMDPLRPDEFFTLQPGETKSLGAWVGVYNLPEKGSYRVQFFYKSDPKLTPRFEQGNAPELLEMLRKTTPLEVKSNIAVVTIG